MPTKQPRGRKYLSITGSIIYNLHLNDECCVRVCKMKFQNTLCITKMTIWNWKNSKEKNLIMKTKIYLLEKIPTKQW